METIQIDFEVFKALTVRRAAVEVTYNDVLRELLGLPPAEQQPANRNGKPARKAWVAKGVTFPHGTEFRATYKGRQYSAQAHDGALVYDGQAFKSPSAAAIAITGNSVNGWKFWECRRPGQGQWVEMYTLWRQQQ